MIELARSAPFATLGKYRLVCELGSGGMAHVYLALTEGLGDFEKLVVLKVMREELGKNPDALKLFLGEARLAARLNHPNVVQTLEVGEDAGRYFIEMEYLEGFPLGALLGKTVRAPLPLAARLEIACQLLDGLGYLHELADLDGSPLGLVHRDISPSNVFVTFEGTVKVLDFGVAKAAGLSEVSVVGSFKGKLGYAAPEQLRGHSDFRSDLFTAGLLLWEMLTYRRLGFDRTQTEIIRGRATGADIELMRDRSEGVPAQLLEICVKATALDPDDRYPSATALRDDLREYLRSNALSSSTAQLRQLLTERFGEQRRATRQDLDRRLKALRHTEHRRTLPTVPTATSVVPHAFVRAAEAPPSEAPRRWLSRPRLRLALGGLLLALGAAVSGSLAFGSAAPEEARRLADPPASTPRPALSTSFVAGNPPQAQTPPSAPEVPTASASPEPRDAARGSTRRRSIARAAKATGAAPAGAIAEGRGVAATPATDEASKVAEAAAAGWPSLASPRRRPKSARPIDSSNPYASE